MGGPGDALHRAEGRDAQLDGAPRGPLREQLQRVAHGGGQVVAGWGFGRSDRGTCGLAVRVRDPGSRHGDILPAQAGRASSPMFAETATVTVPHFDRLKNVDILILGSGAREHALALSLASERTDDGAPANQIFVAPGNAGIGAVAQLVTDLDVLDGDAVSQFAVDNGIDLIVVGPEAPLIAGVVDEPRERGIAVFGPGKAAAQLEGSKAFAKRIMDDAGVPTGRAVQAGTIAEVEETLDAFGAPYVVKADGLAAGKGVLVTEDRAAAVAHAKYWLEQHGTILIEEFLSGEEVSLFFLSDGHTVRALSPAQDYKRAFDGDAGPNTGGMGSYSPLPWLAERPGGEAGFVREVAETIALPVVRRLAEEQTPFIGLLYCGLILTADGIRVIEFNARFGDPETQVVLPRLVTPLSTLLMAAATGTLATAPEPVFSGQSAIAVVLASEGYPEDVKTGRPITGLDAAEAIEGVHVAHAATKVEGEDLVATGGRVLSVVALGDSFTEARERAYEAIDKIDLPGSHFRSDIGLKAVR